jgi:hypothetical protein
MRLLHGIALSLFLTAALACGGGSDGDPVPGGSGESSNLVGSFTPDESTPGADSIAMADGGVSGPVVSIRVNVTEVDDLFTADFGVSFDPALVEFVSWSPGLVLESDGNRPSYLIGTSQPGLINVGASRTGGAAGGVDVGGTGTLIILTFRARAAGASTIAFEGASLLDAQAPPQTISGLSWHGGTLAAN